MTSLVHAIASLSDPGPRCGAAGFPLTASLLPALVTCPECQMAQAANDTYRSESERGNKFQVSGVVAEGKRGNTRGARPKKGVSEKVFRQQVLAAAREAGWLAYFTWTSIHSPAGFPDLVLVKPGKPVLFSELKTAKGTVSAAQRAWLEALAQTTDVIACLWRPEDLAAIRQFLSAP